MGSPGLLLHRGVIIAGVERSVAARLCFPFLFGVVVVVVVLLLLTALGLYRAERSKTLLTPHMRFETFGLSQNIPSGFTPGLAHACVRWLPDVPQLRMRATSGTKRGQREKGRQGAGVNTQKHAKREGWNTRGLWPATGAMLLPPSLLFGGKDTQLERQTGLKLVSVVDGRPEGVCKRGRPAGESVATGVLGLCTSEHLQK